jgi:enoyl-CoA hydratase
MPQPLIAALHGYVLGSGIEIALYCDLRIASPDAVFGFPEVALGILPAAGGTQTLPRTLGLSGALDMLLTGRRLSAQEAYLRGMVSRIVPREELLQTAEDMAQKIASFDPVVVRNAKQSLVRGLDMTLDQGLDFEWKLAAMTKEIRKSSKI